MTARDPDKSELAFLFVANFSDGTSYHQTAEDRSQHDPTKSAYYDVLQLQAQGKKITSFFLVGDGQTYGVDTTDGHFEVDGRPVWFGDAAISHGVEFKLVYFRRNWRCFNVGADGKIEDEQTHFVRYFIGWQADVNGQSMKHVIGID